MGKRIIRTFEELEVYKLTREFSRKVGELIKKLPMTKLLNDLLLVQYA